MPLRALDTRRPLLAARPAQAHRAIRWGLAFALLAAAGCGDPRQSPADRAAIDPLQDRPQRAAVQAPFALDRSTPQLLLESLLNAARATRLEQARSARQSWNAVAVLLQRLDRGTDYDQQLRAACPQIDTVDDYGALDWNVLDLRPLEPSAHGEERQLLLVQLSAYGIALPTPWVYASPAEMILRMPYWLWRRWMPAGAAHPVRPRFLECVQGTAKPRMWLLAIEVQRDADGWYFSGDTIWIEGLLLATEIA